MISKQLDLLNCIKKIDKFYAFTYGNVTKFFGNKQFLTDDYCYENLILNNKFDKELLFNYVYKAYIENVIKWNSDRSYISIDYEPNFYPIFYYYYINFCEYLIYLFYKKNNENILNNNINLIFDILDNFLIKKINIDDNIYFYNYLFGGEHKCMVPNTLSISKSFYFPINNFTLKFFNIESINKIKKKDYKIILDKNNISTLKLLHKTSKKIDLLLTHNISNENLTIVKCMSHYF